MDKINKFDNSPKKYVVARKYYDSHSFDNIEDATSRARINAWESGEDVGIYVLVAIASAEDLVNTIKVTNVQ